MPHVNAERRVLAALLAAYGLYAALFIANTSFVIDGTRYFSLFEDAMISMRYAKHLSEGHGLVWNVGGPRVEGFSNPLWTVLMVMPHVAGLPATMTSLAVQVAGAICLLLTLVVVWKLVLHMTGGALVAAALAVVLVAFYLPLNTWGLQGFEVAPLALLVSAAAWRATSALERGVVDPLTYGLLALATLVRIDAVVFAFCVFAFLVASDPERRTRHLVIGGGMLTLCVLGQTVLRLWYYGDVLPNTYYLKMTGYPVLPRISRGGIVLAEFIGRMNALLFFAPAMLLFRRRSQIVMLLAILVGAACVYSVWVGGDVWEYWGGSNRYISVVMPLFFVLLAVTVNEWGPRFVGGGRRDLTGCQAAVFAVCALGSVNMLVETNSLAEAALIRSPLHVPLRMTLMRTALYVREATDSSARIAVANAGVMPYFLEREYIDILGKNDRLIARQPAHVPSGTFFRVSRGFFPGHVKWDYEYSIRRQRPDVIVDVLDDPDFVTDERHRYVRWTRGEIEVLLRTDSPHINWPLVNRTGSVRP